MTSVTVSDREVAVKLRKAFIAAAQGMHAVQVAGQVLLRGAHRGPHYRQCPAEVCQANKQLAEETRDYERPNQGTRSSTGARPGAHK